MVAGFQEELDSDDQMPDAGSHKVYTYSDSDEDYTASTQAKRVTQPKKQSSRGKPASRLSPAQDRRNDSNLQGFMIESDTSDENDAQPPSILPDAESLSENDLAEAESPKSKPSNHIEQNTATQLYKSDSNQYLRNERNKKTEENDSDSSDNAEDNVMVSNVIEDISSSEEQIPSPVNQVTEELENRLQLQSSDFDFLEQITSKPAQVDTKQSSKPEDRPRKKKSKTPTDETEEGRRHKHKKKKKSKSKEEPINGEEKTGKKKKRRTKTTDDNDLESFLGGGES
uniref:Uncharacterized protein n=1 Tax=Ciona savignyi TaxID=51511 RepID=H2YS56_CIOSA